jgi:hypothetical protein
VKLFVKGEEALLTFTDCGEVAVCKGVPLSVTVKITVKAPADE